MKCPGQDTRHWKEGAVFEVECSECGKPVEFFKDETTRKCRGCGHKMVNPNMDFGCAAYCRFAEQCLGELPPELVAERDELFKDRVAVAAKKHFRRDFKRIAHATKVARHAEAICPKEGGDPAVVLSAAYLHQADGKRAGSGSEGASSERERAAPAAREILEGLGAREDLVDEVADIIESHERAGRPEEESANCKIFHDAYIIAVLEEQWKEAEWEPSAKRKEIEQRLLTDEGRRRAETVLIQ